MSKTDKKFVSLVIDCKRLYNGEYIVNTIRGNVLLAQVLSAIIAEQGVFNSMGIMQCQDSLSGITAIMPVFIMVKADGEVAKFFKK